MEYDKVVLPFVVLRRLDCNLEKTRPDVLEMAASLPRDMDEEARDALLSGVVGTNNQFQPGGGDMRKKYERVLKTEPWQGVRDPAAIKCRFC